VLQDRIATTVFFPAVDEAQQLLDGIRGKAVSPSHVTLMPFLPVNRRLLQRHLTSLSCLQQVRSLLPLEYVGEVLRAACLYVCLSVHSRISKTTRPNFTTFSVCVTCGRGSVLL